MAIIEFLTGLSPLGYSGIIVLMLLVKILITAMYRITFHPLARYPGPFLAKFTDFYSAYHGWHQDTHLDAWRCHKIYGDFVRYGPNKLLVNTSRGYHDIYGHSQNVKKSKSYMPMIPSKGAWSILTAIDKDMHRHKRKLSSKALSDDALKNFEPIMIDYVNVFSRKLIEGLDSSYYSSPKDMVDLCKRLTTDVMGDFGFGQKIGMMTDPSLDFVLRILQSYSWRMGVYEQYPQLTVLHLELLTSLLQSRTEIGRKWKQWSKAFSSAILDRSNQKSKGQFSVILDSKDPNTGKPPLEAELWADGSFMMLAGSDTSAITMCSTFFYLTCNPEAYTKLVTEIRDAFSCLDEIRSGPSLESCIYLTACIEESMRMSPPTPRAPWREVELGGVEVDGKFIPKGCDVGTSIYSILHNEEYFPDPYKYIPERWFPGEILSQEQIDRAREAMNPFSIGPRSCTGRSMALLQIRLVIARVAWLYDFKRAGGSDSHVGAGRVDDPDGRHTATEYKLYAHISAACNGPILVFRQKAEWPASAEEAKG